ncbi:MAG: HPr family phosphocarrier protein [Gemmataceae bacterium]
MPMRSLESPVRRSIRINNPMGLHMRPAGAFASAAQKFSCRILVWKGTNRADGKSMLELMMLAAGQGTELIIESDGEAAAEALDILAEILADPGDGL